MVCYGILQNVVNITLLNTRYSRGSYKVYYSSIPTKLDRNSMKKKDWIKARTQELYDMLPQTTLKERDSYTEIRDEIIELNYSFFGYVAKGTYVTDPMATYEDKLQSALTNFCQMWTKYKFSPEVTETSDTTKKEKKYRTDLSFAVFFKPRLTECIKRELNTIKYSLRRTICMKAAAQVGKHWGQLTKEDIPNIKLNPQEMRILESIFCTQYDTQYDEVTPPKVKSAIQSDFIVPYGIDGIYTEDYDALEDLIVHEMIECECKLDDAYLLKMSQMYGIPYNELEKARPIGEYKLKKQLEEYMDIQESFETETEYETCGDED